MKAPKYSDLPERFWDKVRLRRGRPRKGVKGACWLWAAYTTRNGYGRFGLSNPSCVAYAHRVAFLNRYGPDSIPKPLELDHLCRVRNCCNPDHLEAVTRRVNVLRGDAPALAGERLAARNRAKTHCPADHPYSGANLYANPSDGARVFRTCQREADKRRYRKRKRR